MTFVIVAVGVVVGVYFAGQLSDGTTAAQEGAEKPTATPPGAVIQVRLADSGEPEPGPREVPTCPPPTPTPTPPPPGESGPTASGEAAPRPWPCIPADQPPPDKTPDLSSLFQRDREPEECDTCIDLSKPIPYEVPMKVAGKEIHLPVGSTHKLIITECPPAGVPDRGPCPPKLLDVIERGGSKLVIDAETGEIIEWNVAQQDEADFRRLILEPLQES